MTMKVSQKLFKHTYEKEMVHSSFAQIDFQVNSFF